MFRRKNILTTLSLICVITVSLYFFTACGKGTTAPSEEVKQNKKVIKIGAILPLTGNIAFFGEYEKNAIEIALSKVKENVNGRSIEVIYEDSKNDPKTAVSAINKLINNDKVVAVVTQMTSVTYAIAPVAQRNKIVLLTLAMDPKVAQIGDYIFRIYESIGDESERLAEYFIKEGLKDIGLIYLDDLWGIEAQNKFETKLSESGEKILFKEGFPGNLKDFKNLIQKMGSKRVKNLYIAAYGPSVAIFSKQLKEVFPEIKLFGNIGMSWDFVIKMGGQALDESIVVMPNFYAPEYEDTYFVKEYKQRFGKYPNFESAFTFDLFNILISVIKKYGDSPNNIKEGLEKEKEFSGINGKYILDKNGSVNVPSVTFRRIKNGKLWKLK
jgi:branched-chain amino acid transport system substrate-binding protein